MPLALNLLQQYGVKIVMSLYSCCNDDWENIYWMFCYYWGFFGYCYSLMGKNTFLVIIPIAYAICALKRSFKWAFYWRKCSSGAIREPLNQGLSYWYIFLPAQPYPWFCFFVHCQILILNHINLFSFTNHCRTKVR